MFKTIHKNFSLLFGLLVYMLIVPGVTAATTKPGQQSKRILYAQSYYDLWSELREFNQRQRERQNELARIEKIRQAKQSARASIPELESKKDYLNLALAWRTLEEWDKGLDAAEKAIAAYPNVARPYVVRATIKIELKDIVGAIADYDRAIVVEPDFHGFYKVRGRLKGRADRHGAIQDFRMAMKLVRVDNRYNLIRDSELRLLTEELRSLGATEKKTF